MDWLIGILLLVVGGVIGYFVAKFVNERKLLTEKEKGSEQSFKEIMAQHAATHVQESKQLVQQLVQKAESLTQQIEAYEQLVVDLSTNEDNASLSYFGEHATAYIRHSKSSQSKEKSSTEFQPLDFSAQSSGLFSGGADKKVKNVKQ